MRDRRHFDLTRRELMSRALGLGAAAGTGTLWPALSWAGQAAPAGQGGRGRGAGAPAGPPSLSRQFARWVAALKYEDLPPAVVDRAKGLTLQGLSSALLGSQMP